MGLLANLFPEWALKRAIARRRLAHVKALYESATPTRTHPLLGSILAPDTTMQRANIRLRGVARDMDENNDLIIGVLDDLVDWVIGTGLTIEPMMMNQSGELAEEVNLEAKQLYQEWSLRPDTTQELPMGELERLVARSLYRDGEIFIQHVMGRGYPYPTPIPYALELLEADYVPFDYSAGIRQGRGRIVQGVEKDTWGRPLGYYFWKWHPGEQGYVFPGEVGPQNLKRVSAQEITHLKFTRRVRQTRGVPIIHGVIKRTQDIKYTEDSERIAARADADITAFVRNIPGMGEDVNRGEGVHKESKSDSGMMVHTFEGEQIDVHSPKRPNAQLESFRNGQIRMVAAGTGTRYSSIANDFNGTYSAQRQELVEGQISYAKLREYSVGVFYKPMWRRFVDSAILSGQLDASGIDERTLYHADFRGPPLPWIDPEKELKARQGMVEAGFASRAQMIRDFGGDPADVDKQREQDDMEEEQDEEMPLPGEVTRIAER